MRDSTQTAPRPCRAVLARRLAVAASLASLTWLTACGGPSGDSRSTGGSGDDRGVASVTGGDKKPTEAAPQAERPLIRPDTSAEEEDRLIQVYTSCLEQHGYKKLEGYSGKVGDPNKPDSATLARNEARFAPAQKACAAKEPEELWQRAYREDPEYQDKFDKWLKCMRSHGLEVAPSPDDPGTFSFEDGLPPVNEEKWVDKCEAEAFTGE
ncbi:hypothetical protein PV415_22565 [Streptomyces sp. ME03-5684b]|uniref:hypothetical protein n=1 Tax=Streptomyces sp. ME03-5684b TaxID=3028681 RepID=UPI0029A8BAEA|nr:hypothetical protein [Streptomyces sp. ME03-5684b]MDX3319693.1 hypothetical protein [Streptomyces sp. ME03-5684b]